MAVKFANNASGTLASSLTSTATSVTVQSGQGALYPALVGGAGDYFYCTLVDASNNLEIVKVTARTGDSMLIVRGQDGTAARAFAVGEKLELRLVAATMKGLADVDWQLSLIGTVYPYFGGTCPPRFVPCDGRLISRSTYARLFAVITTAYGAGDGATTFGVPDCRARTLVGANGMFGGAANTAIVGAFDAGWAGGEWSHMLSLVETPIHTHGVTDPGHVHGLSDPHHTHGVTDPGHAHAMPQTPLLTGGANGVAFGTNYQWSAGVTSASYTGLSVAASATGISLVAAATGLSITNAGSGGSHNNVQPSLGANVIMYAGPVS